MSKIGNIERNVDGIISHRSRRGIGVKKRTALSIFLVLGIALSLTAGAALLSYYGQVRTTINVRSPVLFDGQHYGQNGNGYGDITVSDDLGHGGIFWIATKSSDTSTPVDELGPCHTLSLDAEYPHAITVGISTGGTIGTEVYGECDDVGPSGYEVPTTDCTITVGTADYPTIQDAVDAAIIAATGTDGTSQVICVLQGIYEESVIIDMSGCDDNGITLASIDGPSVTTIDPPDDSNGITIENTGNTGTGTVTVEGFTIQDYTGTGAGGCAEGIYVNGVINVYIEYNIIQGTVGSSTSADSIYLKGGAIATITYNELCDNQYTIPTSSSTAAGVSVHVGCTATVTHNSIHDNDFNIHVKSDANGEAPVVTAHYNNILDPTLTLYDFYYEPNGGTSTSTTLDATDNWWGCDGAFVVSDSVNAGWYSWDSSVTLQPGQTRFFLVHYTYAGNVGDIGDGTATGWVKFI